MARILIGNITGPQGERGPQGIQGPVGPVGPQGPLPPLVNNGLTTEAGKAALDAAYGKTMTDKLTELYSDKVNKSELNSKTVEVTVSSTSDKTEITQMADTGGRWIPVIVGHGTKIDSMATVSFDGAKWYISATVAQMYRIIFYKYPSI